MIDTLAITHQLVDAGLEQRPAEAIARTIRNAQGDSATQDFVRAETGSLRAEIGKLRADLTEQINTLHRWVMGLGFGVIAGVLAQLVFQILQQ